MQTISPSELVAQIGEQAAYIRLLERELVLARSRQCEAECCQAPPDPAGTPE